MEEQTRKQKQINLHLTRLECAKSVLRDKTIERDRVVSALESCTDPDQRREFLKQKVSYDNMIDSTRRQMSGYKAQLRHLINMDEATFRSVYPARFKRSHSEERDREDTTNQGNIVDGRRKRTQTTFYSSDHSNMVEPPTDVSIQVYQGDYAMAQYERSKQAEARGRQMGQSSSTL